MIMDKLNNVHPGEVLIEEFLNPMGVSVEQLSRDIDIPHEQLFQIIKGKQRLNADLAIRLSSYFGNSAKFWLGLQDDYDIEEALQGTHKILDIIRQKAPKPI